MAGRKPKPDNTSTFRGRFAANLRALRTAQFATQAEFADALRRNLPKKHHGKVDVSTVCGWETLKRTPKIELFPFIAKTLDCPVRELLPES
jgi:transcriptional regulator with XRE-family HTH domain